MIAYSETMKHSNYFNFTLLLDDFLVSEPTHSPPPSKHHLAKEPFHSDISTDLGSDSSHRGSLLSSPEKPESTFTMHQFLGRERLLREFTSEPESPRKSRFSLSECFKHSSSDSGSQNRVSDVGTLTPRPKVLDANKLRKSLKNRHFGRLARKLKRVFENGRRFSS